MHSRQEVMWLLSVCIISLLLCYRILPELTNFRAVSVSLRSPISGTHNNTQLLAYIVRTHSIFFCTCIKYSNSNISEQLCYLPPGGVSYNLAHWTTCTCTCYLSKVNPLLTLKDGSSSWMCWIEHKNANTCET